MRKTKYIFVSGGVYSSVGKGLIIASIASIFKHQNYKINVLKLDPYLNVDSGTMSPYEHGEVFVTSDGAETDLDLGYYERFLVQNLSEKSSVTSGKVYFSVINKERKGEYLGKTVQLIPHVTNEIKKRIYDASNNGEYDLVFCEIGGTVGDLESLPFIEAIKQIIRENDKQTTAFIHVVPIISLSNSESKTKPLQHSLKELNNLGINPDFLVVRSKTAFDQTIKNKIANSTYLDVDHIFSSIDLDNVYFLPHYLYNQKIHEKIASKLQIQINLNQQLDAWNDLVDKINNKNNLTKKLAIIGKYTKFQDAYASLIESINLAGYHNNVKLDIEWIESSKFDDSNLDEVTAKIKQYDGVVVAGGFGNRGVEGKIKFIQAARINKIPFLGICLGMQLACVEYARNVLGLENANSREFDSNTQYPIFKLMEQNNDNIGGSLRLGDYEVSFQDNTLIKSIYQSDKLKRRHRHRYEFNNDYLDKFNDNNFVISGVYQEKNLVETIEIKDHPFFIGCQYHPEFSSKITHAEALFDCLVKKMKML
ncbi:CTP synthase [Mycoplasma bradburyae]|uniref:CTP synthase n=1 Tax=Mycoplasma bradburyae TaxID=2963128 RepID=A0AAW6HQ73_9MOLU|nr:CTP synthase [Mycoplasma bradburyae]MDC4182134.1 CTP synthase [Mycoplasma bradburyae]MDC4183582.1 CTP synthase [Mycoplasma bradburyae]MDC4184320.1 CTP synthase [Mycoplasma bradburyae]UTS70297.1 CTP synthase [Mycoplasma bradburyae]UTS71021.1 CTP synthase [Mycoplasma bradburyae]